MESKVVRMTAALRERWADYWSGGRSRMTLLERRRFEARYHRAWQAAEKALELDLR